MRSSGQQPAWAGIVFCAGLFACLAAGEAVGGEWQEVSRTANLAIAVRERNGNAVKELKAVGMIDAPTWAVRNVLADVEAYTKFMPYTTEARVLNKDVAAGTSLVYMKLNPPLVGPRDVTLRIQDEISKAPDGNVVYNSRWTAENASGPAAQPGVTRMNLDEGSWTLEPAVNGRSTKATYLLFTDAGGNLPSFVVNLANKRSVTDLFEAIRKQVRNEKYRQAQPEPGS